MSTVRVAVLGMGRMGAAMTRHLAERGFPLAVYNRNAERARSVAADIGATLVATPADAAAWAADGDGAGIVVTSLADDAACRAVYLGESGLVGALAPGTVACDTSTISPELARDLDAAVAGRGASFLNSPVSGSVPAALSGGLTLMVGGDAAALEAARPVLEAIGSKVAHVGGPGSGAVVKLAVNSILHTFNQALSESIVLVERAGVDRSVFYDVIAGSAVAAPFVGYKREAFERPDEAPVAFSIDLMAKDLRLVRALADEVGASMPGATTASDVAAQAISHGYRDEDMSAIARFLREQ
jgi:3-hydroxyisobutyrate dehydrogenase-like beta-hydroxyacid dehydrogenase